MLARNDKRYTLDNCLPSMDAWNLFGSGLPSFDLLFASSNGNIEYISVKGIAFAMAKVDALYMPSTNNAIINNFLMTFVDLNFGAKLQQCHELCKEKIKLIRL